MLLVILAMLKENAVQRELSLTFSSFWQLTLVKTQMGMKIREQSSFPLHSGMWQLAA